MSGETGQAEIAGLLIALRMKGETIDEISGFAETMRALATPIKTARKPLRGSVSAQTADELVFNPFFSTHAAMVWGVERFAKKKIKSVKPDIPEGKNSGRE